MVALCETTEHPLPDVRRDDLAHHRQGAGEHRHARLASRRREGERVRLPRGVLAAEALASTSPRVRPSQCPCEISRSPSRATALSRQRSVMIAAVSALRDSGLQ